MSVNTCSFYSYKIIGFYAYEYIYTQHLHLLVPLVIHTHYMDVQYVPYADGGCSSALFTSAQVTLKLSLCL